jgi:hypothetical protein
MIEDLGSSNCGRTIAAAIFFVGILLLLLTLGLLRCCCQV